MQSRTQESIESKSEGNDLGISNILPTKNGFSNSATHPFAASKAISVRNVARHHWRRYYNMACARTFFPTKSPVLHPHRNAQLFFFLRQVLANGNRKKKQPV